MPDEPKRYVVQKHVMANSVREALEKEPDTPVQSVFPDSNQDSKPTRDAIGFKFSPYASIDFPEEDNMRLNRISSKSHFWRRSTDKPL